MSTLLDTLNPEQRAAVEATEGPVCLLAGAGSGKTRVLTHRIAHLVHGAGVHPSEILAVTFTNKAAGEMRERVRRLLGPDGDDLWVSTFHSACVRILRSHAAEMGRDPNFVIYDDKEQLDLLKRVVTDLNLDAERYHPKAMASLIDKAKNDARRPDETARSGLTFFHEKFADVYRAYQEELRRNNAYDFGDLILETLRLFQEAPQVLQAYQQRLRHVLVDEYQDTNRAQYLLVRALTALHGNLCVVGDDDQSIYSWRGADIRNILDFNRDYPDATVIKLEQNYRSTKTILAAAHHVVRKNARRTDKELWTENEEGEPITLFVAEDDREEARFVLERIREELRNGRRLGELAVMYRMNSLSRIFEEALLKEKIPYQIIGGMKFYDRKEVKDLLNLLRFLINGRDSVSFRRVYENFARGVGKGSIDKIDALARSRTLDYLDAAVEAVDTKVVGGAATARVREFTHVLLKAREEMVDLGVRELAAYLLLKTS
jgi:DNA helicase II / ATP-dependent DNA helicase PcrA